MKKSTLITTIAMIVVVVVALSTATYAWFSTTTTAVAGATFSTEASGDWSMIEGTISNVTAAGGANLNYTSAAAASLNLTDFALANDLWAPDATIATAITDSLASTTITGLASFTNAKVNGSTAILQKYMSAGYKYTKVEDAWEAAACEAGEYGYAQPIALRVINVSGQNNKELMLGITINVGSDSTKTTTMYAGAAVRFYIYVIPNAGEAKSYTSGYNKSVVPEGTINLGSTEITKAGTAQAANNYTGGLLDYTAGNILSSYSHALADDTLLGIATNDYYKTYTLSLGTFAAAGYANIIIYPWVDGWVADTSAAAASFSVKFGFYSPVAASSSQS